MELSAYCINSEGVLCYTGLPVMGNLTFMDHNNVIHLNVVWAVSQFGLLHGKQT